MIDLHVDSELRNLIAPLRPDEYKELEASILRDGCLEPLTVWKHDGKNILLDGHTRHTICTEHNRKFEIVSVKLEAKENARLWIEEHQIARRNLTDDQRAIIWNSIRERRAKRAIAERTAKAREVKSLQANSVGVKTTPIENARKASPVRVREQIANESGLSENTLRVAKKVAEKSPKLADAVRMGEISLREAKAKAFKKENEKTAADKNRFDRAWEFLEKLYHDVDEVERENDLHEIIKKWKSTFTVSRNGRVVPGGLEA